MSPRLAAIAVILALAGAAASPAGATTVLAVPDAALVDQAALIVQGRVVELPAPPEDRAVTDYRLSVERILKGEAQGSEIVVRVLGGRAGRRELRVWGAPRFAVGERVLLFLGPRHADSAYRPLHLALGAFRSVMREGRLLAERDLSEIVYLEPEGREVVETAERDLRRFSEWVADRAAGRQRPTDYLVAPGARAAVAEPFTYLGGVKQRWPDFDQGRDVPWLAHEGGQPQLPGGGFNEFQLAINAWKGDPATNIRYRYQGTTTASAGFTHFDGLNVILFEDPNNEAEGVFECFLPGRGSGVLAIGGTWSDHDTTPARIEGADIVVNNGAGCWFTTSKRAEQVYGHELGHTLGLGHACGDARSGDCDTQEKNQALMRATAHSDNRGAALNSDDRAGILSLYPGADPAGPAAPSNLTASALSSTAIQLGWQDNADNETLFEVEMKSAGGSFQRIASPAANITSFQAAGLAPATAYTFRVRAKNARDASAFSNQASATTLSALQPPAAPTKLVAVPFSDTQIRLTWMDKSANETEFQLAMSSPVQAFKPVATPGANATSATVGGLAPDTPYTFRLRARNAAGASAFSNQASATTTGTTGPCVAGAETLCLLGGRFRVEVAWRIGATGANGHGMAVPQTDQSGLFWFFGPSNIELIVKVLDGRAINGHFWTFYGALSDVEYWIAVTDTQNPSPQSASKTYHNAAGNLCGGADVNSLAGAGTLGGRSGAAPAGAARPAVSLPLCAPGTLCLLDGRFQVEVTWRNPNDGSTGVGTPVPLAGSDQSGLFWFFNEDNLELVVKALDGIAVNGKYWFFYGALSDVEYDIRVTDTATQQVRTYHNAAGNYCSKGDTSAFPVP